MPTGNRHHCLCLDLIHHLEVCFSVCVSLCVCLPETDKDYPSVLFSWRLSVKGRKGLPEIDRGAVFLHTHKSRARLLPQFSCNFVSFLSLQARKTEFLTFSSHFCKLISFTQLSLHPFLLCKFTAYTHIHIRVVQKTCLHAKRSCITCKSLHI